MIPIPSHPVPWSHYRDGLCFGAPYTQLTRSTHKVGSWSHHLVDDAEDLVDDVEDFGDCAETLDGLKKHL